MESGLEKLRRICRKHDIQTVCTTMDTLQQQLTRVKDIDPTLKKSGVVIGYLAAVDWRT